MKKSNVKIINFYLTKLFFNKHSISMKIPLGRLSSYYRKKTDDIHTNVMMLKKEKELIYQFTDKKREKKRTHTWRIFDNRKKNSRKNTFEWNIRSVSIDIWPFLYLQHVCLFSRCIQIIERQQFDKLMFIYEKKTRFFILWKMNIRISFLIMSNCSNMFKNDKRTYEYIFLLLLAFDFHSMCVCVCI